jgi:hypothetical protein
MTSQLNVDTIVDKAGSGGSNVKMANTSTYVSDGGSATQNTVQGLVKAWLAHDASQSITDSLNVSSITDHSTGIHTYNFTNNWRANLSYTMGGSCTFSDDNTTPYVRSIEAYGSTHVLTGSLKVSIQYTNSGSQGFYDYLWVNSQYSGDLA